MPAQRKIRLAGALQSENVLVRRALIKRAQQARKSVH
jgi:hypothetical protein